MITQQDLIDAGYKRYENTNRSLNPSSDYFYQKRFRDEIGTRYFIEFWHYPPIEIRIPERIWGESWTPETHIYDKDSQPIFKATFFTPESVEQIERVVDKLWMQFRGYYE